ncbi:hypothetical protein PPTG_19612 [Phytophthora nicotianae INRA-310]|uniref:HAT C-terminal dimerisation domain-containing protein n=1 Tax=Phytophthora nicotianae (strain INRA-310) TaxID=761204 RepID=W2PBA9_PHYN3|nr:hypothetical protein PPTG_19612 [Phytophthora nicotianae INRA-310]ETM98322.1 hypothetical protein PPTG_19612 [Phytophthora nicotianae INRA-310]
MDVPLIGCASHRLNRAVAAQLKEHADDLDLVQTLMLKLRTLTQSAELRLKTSLRPITRQQTRWGSTFAMLNRFFELLPFLDADDEELAVPLPSHGVKRRLKNLLGELKDVESVSKAQQGGEVNLLDVRVWFDGLIAKKESYSTYLEFESGCVRLLKGQALRLTRGEKAALEAFGVSPVAQGERQGDDDEAGASFVERLRKHRRLEQYQPAYELLSRIPPTSNVVERFFSVARTTFGLQRHSLLPYTLEMLLFLRQNERFWDALFQQAECWNTQAANGLSPDDTGKVLPTAALIDAGCTNVLLSITGSITDGSFAADLVAVVLGGVEDRDVGEDVGLSSSFSYASVPWSTLACSVASKAIWKVSLKSITG